MRKLKTMNVNELKSALIAETVAANVTWGSVSLAQFCDSIFYAEYLHEGQFRDRRGNVAAPAYIEHPLRNALRLVRWGCKDGEALTAAMLHDTVEDCIERITGNASESDENRDFAFSILSDRYSEQVSNVVRGMSNPVMPRYAPRAERVASYVDHLREAVADPQIRGNKVSDLGDNAGSLHYSVTESTAKSVRRRHDKYAVAIPVVIDVIKRSDSDLPGLSNARLVKALHSIQRNMKIADTQLLALGF